LVAPAMPDGQMTDFYRPERFPDWPARYRVQMGYHGFRRAILSTRVEAVGRDMTGDYTRLGGSGTPVLLLWGREDQTIPLAVGQELRKLLPGAEFHVIDEAGHVPYMERPDVVNPLVLDFLARLRVTSR